MAFGDDWCADLPKNRPDYDAGFPGMTGEVCSNIVSKTASNGADSLAYDLMIQAYITENRHTSSFSSIYF